MAKIISHRIILFFLMIAFQSCQKTEVTEQTSENQSESSLDTSYGGGGTTSCSYPQLSTHNLPILNWMLEGSINDYQSYATNKYFKFGSAWLSGSSYLCNGQKKVHNAWDIHRPNFAQINGKKVYAAYAGFVKAVYNAGTGFAQGLTIEHKDLQGNFFTTNYTHIVAIDGVANTNVAAGQHIGFVADLDNNDHLHFSLRRASYSNYANNGALPKYLNDNNCLCGGQPVFPEYFVNPGELNFQERTSVTETRVISLSGSLAFGSVIIGSPQSKELIIRNNGNSTLKINSITLPTGYSSNYYSGTIAANSYITANINFNPQNMVTNYNGVITVDSNSTSGVNTISVSGTGLNNVLNPNPTPTPSQTPNFNPTTGIKTGCSFEDKKGTGDCTGTYLGSNINMRVGSYNQSNNTITFIITKCSGSFSNSGTAYIKEGGFCGKISSSAVSYKGGDSSISVTVTPPSKSGVYTYTAVLVSATTDKIYSLPISVQY